MSRDHACPDCGNGGMNDDTPCVCNHRAVVLDDPAPPCPPDCRMCEADAAFEAHKCETCEGPEGWCEALTALDDQRALIYEEEIP